MFVGQRAFSWTFSSLGRSRSRGGIGASVRLSACASLSFYLSYGTVCVCVSNRTIRTDQRYGDDYHASPPRTSCTCASSSTASARRSLGRPSSRPTATEPQSARDVSYNPEHHDRMKHVQRPSCETWSSRSRAARGALRAHRRQHRRLLHPASPGEAVPRNASHHHERVVSSFRSVPTDCGPREGVRSRLASVCESPVGIHKKERNGKCTLRKRLARLARLAQVGPRYSSIQGKREFLRVYACARVLSPRVPSRTRVRPGPVLLWVPSGTRVRPGPLLVFRTKREQSSKGPTRFSLLAHRPTRASGDLLAYFQRFSY